jgi:hypothetical protein
MLWWANMDGGENVVAQCSKGTEAISAGLVPHDAAFERHFQSRTTG